MANENPCLTVLFLPNPPPHNLATSHPLPKISLLQASSAHCLHRAQFSVQRWHVLSKEILFLCFSPHLFKSNMLVCFLLLFRALPRIFSFIFFCMRKTMSYFSCTTLTLTPVNSKNVSPNPESMLSMVSSLSAGVFSSIKIWQICMQDHRFSVWSEAGAIWNLDCCSFINGAMHSACQYLYTVLKRLPMAQTESHAEQQRVKVST